MKSTQMIFTWLSNETGIADVKNSINNFKPKCNWLICYMFLPGLVFHFLHDQYSFRGPTMIGIWLFFIECYQRCRLGFQLLSEHLRCRDGLPWYQRQLCSWARQFATTSVSKINVGCNFLLLDATSCCYYARSETNFGHCLCYVMGAIFCCEKRSEKTCLDTAIATWHKICLHA